MKKTVIVNIYNFIRMSHVEPSIFIPDDFETVRNQMTLIRQYGFPATYALKYDALMEPRYQELIREYKGDDDEIGAWWEITGELCRRAGVAFRGGSGDEEEYDERVNSAYSIGYEPWERRKLVDAYMEDFYDVFGFYPRTIGSWVLDTVTVAHAAEKYGIVGSAICRDQMGTDGFTLWGGYPNGIYYPSRGNENIPANTREGQLGVPMFRLLGPDPIYNFEQDVRRGLQGVYTLEPSWLIGRDPDWIDWFFDALIQEDTIGVGYAHVGQENNFLWENIRPGLEPQMEKLERLRESGAVRIETMASSARWFRNTCKITPPMTFQASGDWDSGRQLSAAWYACSNYRLGFLGEEGHLRIRDLFLYRQDYLSRYLESAMKNAKSCFDALPLLFPQRWKRERGERPFIRLVDENGLEPAGEIEYHSEGKTGARVKLLDAETGAPQGIFTLSPGGITLEGGKGLCFDTLPVYVSHEGKRVCLQQGGFDYEFEVRKGEIRRAGRGGLEIGPEAESGIISLRFGEEIGEDEIFFPEAERIAGESGWEPFPWEKEKTENKQNENERFTVPLMAPAAEPRDWVFPAGSEGIVKLAAKNKGDIHYTLDGTEPGKDSPVYTAPIVLRKKTTVRAKLIQEGGRCSETVSWTYCFGIPNIRLTSFTRLDPRPVFRGQGITDLLDSRRGSLDYLDGRWRGTLEDLEICGDFEAPEPVESVAVGFLSHHRAGIIYPEKVQLYTGPDRGHLSLTAEVTLPWGPCAREIARGDVVLPVGKTIGSFRVVACRYERMPQWCCYKGSKGVFTMADNCIVTPMEDAAALSSL